MMDLTKLRSELEDTRDRLRAIADQCKAMDYPALWSSVNHAANALDDAVYRTKLTERCDAEIDTYLKHTDLDTTLRYARERENRRA